MSDIDKEIDEVGKEIDDLRAEVQTLREARLAARHDQHHERIINRKAPPLSSMTRIQKRYFLEPWYTFGAVTSGALSAGSFITGAAIWSWRFIVIGLVFLAVGGVFAWAKLNHYEMNVSTEGNLLAAKKPRDDGW